MQDGFWAVLNMDEPRDWTQSGPKRVKELSQQGTNTVISQGPVILKMTIDEILNIHWKYIDVNNAIDKF